VLISVVKNPPPHLSHAHPSITRVSQLDRFLQRVLSKNPGDRPRDAVSFFREFEHALFGDKRPPRVAAKVPPEDAPFATVWAASLDLRREDATDITDMSDRFTREPSKVGQPGQPRTLQSKRRLASGWMRSLDESESLQMGDTVEDMSRAAAKAVRTDDADPHGPTVERAPAARPLVVADEAMPTVERPAAKSGRRPAPSLYSADPANRSDKGLYAGSRSRPDRTELVRLARSPRSAWVWLVPLLVGLVVFAAALGYVVGRGR
jgi:hypothetical protein